MSKTLHAYSYFNVYTDAPREYLSNLHVYIVTESTHACREHAGCNTHEALSICTTINRIVNIHEV